MPSVKQMLKQVNEGLEGAEVPKETKELFDNLFGEIDKIISERDEAKEKIRNSQGSMSAEEAAKLRRENDNLKSEIEDLKGQLDQTAKKLEKTEKAKQDFETKHSELQGQIKQDKISKAITDKLSELNVDSSAIPDERDLLLLRNQVDLTDDGKVVIGEKELDEFMKEHKDSPRMKKIIKAPQNNGGGSGNAGGAGSGKNPWSKDHFNLTEQGRLLKEDPELAKQMKAEAGAKE